ncbi:EutN/CcmL family microcompartment protein [Paenibacillus sp. MSJ-34]|uniref:EutN/CcmL family microcompartment protein n=1 Tax=Paenibacillus sp. MSJ-34 TaxID=2841529 RepID=UPI001C1282A5|nr:EutN/CcmL family microcompartment protein [Paenibacillus sp. MSJ-34]MBU5441259.1 EutN/CcmL family microcompartment protein [Paenibacillus sp. MSJ-34]
MFLGKVVGSVVCTHKDESLSGLKLLVIQPMKDAEREAGKRVVAIDTIGVSGYGDLVYLAKSRESGLPLGLELVAADAGIMGIVDHYHTIKTGRGRI